MMTEDALAENHFTVFSYDGDNDHEVYDVGVFLCGYETRSMHVAQTLRHQVRSLRFSAFDDQQAIAAPANRSLCIDHGWAVDTVGNDHFRPWLSRVLQVSLESRKQGTTGPLRVLVDISSLTRQRLASTLQVLLQANLKAPMQVDFVYALSQFSPPPLPSDVGICRPVSQFFAGTPAWPGRSSTAVIGLGYERHRALGVAEYLDPDELIIFSPEGTDERFDAEVAAANRLLLTRPGPTPVKVEYQVLDPFSCFVGLESFLHSRRRNRTVIAPMGPKVFALSALLAAAAHRADVSVWRVSSGDRGQTRDQVANGSLAWLRVEFHP